MSPQLAHAIRLLLEYTETPYQERQYRPGPGEGGKQGVPPSMCVPPPWDPCHPGSCCTRNQPKEKELPVSAG